MTTTPSDDRLGLLEHRAQAIVSHANVTLRGAASSESLADAREPPDLGAIFAVTDGLELRDGTRILRRDEIRGATAWLVSERSLEWGDDLWVIGERDDLVIVRDLDASGVRASGGVVEAPTDGLSRLTREAPDLVSYLEGRLAIEGPAEKAPERAAREAIRAGDADGIARAIERTFYPGSMRDLAHAALVLGGLRARAGDDARALTAFTTSVTARVRAAARGAESSEARAGWRACAVAAEKAGSPSIAAACRARASS